MAAMASFCSRLIIPRICARTSLSTSVMQLSSLSRTGAVIRSFPSLPLRCPRSYYYVKPKEKKGPSFKSWLIFGVGCVAVATGAIIYVGKTVFILFYYVSHENVWVKNTSPSWWICGSPPPPPPLPKNYATSRSDLVSEDRDAVWTQQIILWTVLTRLRILFIKACRCYIIVKVPFDHSWGKRFGYRIKINESMGALKR